MISTATTVTKPSATIRAKIANVELVSIGSKYFMKYIILVGNLKEMHYLKEYNIFPSHFLEILCYGQSHLVIKSPQHKIVKNSEELTKHLTAKYILYTGYYAVMIRAILVRIPPMQHEQ
jgi:hypothetical protein